MRLFNGLILLLFASCASPEERLTHLQLDFISDRPQGDFFEIISEEDSIRLPLPPNAQYTVTVREFAEKFRKKAYAIDPQAAKPETKEALFQFRTALDSICARQTRDKIDPRAYTLGELLRHFSGDNNVTRHPALMSSVISKIPAYYQQIQERWSAADPLLLEQAVAQSVAALDHLQVIEQNSKSLSTGFQQQLAQSIPPARIAIKDFIGLCQSGFLKER